MAKLWSNEVRVFYEGINLGTATTRLSLSLEQDTIERTAFGDAAESFLPGVRRDSIEWAGMYDNTTALDTVFGTLIGSATKVISVMVGTATGSRAFAGTGALLMKGEVARIADIVRQEASFKPDQAWDSGIHYGGAVTITAVGGSGVSGSVDNGGSTLSGGTIYLHVLAGSFGGGTAVVLLQHGSVITDFADLATFGGINALTGSLQAISGTVRQWTRMRVTNNGTTLTIANVLKRG